MTPVGPDNQDFIQMDTTELMAELRWLGIQQGYDWEALGRLVLDLGYVINFWSKHVWIWDPAKEEWLAYGTERYDFVLRSLFE